MWRTKTRRRKWPYGRFRDTTASTLHEPMQCCEFQPPGHVEVDAEFVHEPCCSEQSQCHLSDEFVVPPSTTNDASTADSHESHHHTLPPRKRVVHRIAQITFLSCLLAASSRAALTTTPSPAECEASVCPRAPRLAHNNNVNPFQLFLEKRGFPQPKVSQLGDGQRSSEAADSFFDSLDIDGDGTLRSDEVAVFLREEIGGTSFDTEVEVDDEVSTVLESLDQNHDSRVQLSDVMDHWLQLESLLTAEEVADWVVYAVQLPSSVGKIFLENGVTGYDFPEIVEDGGNRIKDELGIDKPSFQSKIVRHIQARMLGIGSVPVSPKEFTHKLESCKAVTLTWKKSVARAFPVHSYRVQRRAVNLHIENSVNDSSMYAVPNDGSSSVSIPTSSSDWKTVYVGGDTEFVDSGLEIGHNYMYRVQAWNSVGRSEWESTDLSRVLKKLKCSTKINKKVVTETGSAPRQFSIHQEEDWEWLDIPYKIVWAIILFVQFSYQFMRVFFAVLAIGAAMMRFRRASATTSASTAVATLPFPWFWKGLNKFSNKLTGYDCIPKSMLGDKEAILRQEKLHDASVSAVGLRGYDRLYARQVTAITDVKNGNGVVKFNGRDSFGREKSYSTGNLQSVCQQVNAPMNEVIVPSESGPVFKSPLKFYKRSQRSLGGLSESSEERVDGDSKSLNDRLVKSERPYLDRKKILKQRTSSIDDGKSCVVCEKKFKFGKRWKHHCSRCMATFCHKHGYCTHNHLVSCKVPGTCLCNPCIKKLKERSERSSDYI